MTMSDFLLLMLVMLGGSLLLTVVFLWLLVRRVEQRIEQDLWQAIQQSRPRYIGLDVEQLQGIFYCYHADSKEFICQGTTVDELRMAFSQRFPHHAAYIVGGDESVIDMLKDKLAADKREISDSQ